MRSNDITNVTQHRDHLRDHLNQVKDTGRPLFITNKGGETEAVMLSAQAYDEMAEKAALSDSLSMLDRSMDDIKAGRTRPFREAIKGMIEEFGGKLKQ